MYRISIRPALPGSSSVIVTGPPSALRQPLLEVAHRRRLLRPACAACALLAARERFLTSASVARTDRPLSTTVRAARSIAAALVEPEQGAGVAHRQPLVLDHLAHDRRQLEQADRVRDRAAILADALGDLVLRQAELVDQALERGRPPRAARGRSAGRSRRARARTRPASRPPGRRPAPRAGPPAAPRASAARRRSGSSRPRARGRTTSGTITPCTLIESASSTSLASVEVVARLLGARIDLLDLRAEVRAARDRRLRANAARAPRVPSASSADQSATEPTLLEIGGHHAAGCLSGRLDGSTCAR